MGKFQKFKAKDRTVVGERRRRTHFSVAKVNSYVVNTGLNNAIVKKPSAFSFDALQDALESVLTKTSTAKFQLQDLSAEGVERRVRAEFKAAFKRGISRVGIHDTRSLRTSQRFYAFSQEPITADEVFKIKFISNNENGTFSIGFTSCNPDRLKPSQIPNQATDQSSINNQAIYVEQEAGFWKYFNYDISMGRRVLLKMKSNGEVLLWFGERDFRVLTVDNQLEPIWWFVHLIGDVKFVEVHTTRCDYDYVEEVERPLGNNELTSGLPITSAGVLDSDFKHRAMAEFQQTDWQTREYEFLTLYDNNSCCGDVSLKLTRRAEIYGFSNENIKVDQIIEIVWNLQSDIVLSVNEVPDDKIMTVGFTDRHPGSVDLYSLQVNKPGFQGRPDHWVFTNVDITAASRVWIKIKIDGEVMMLVGEEGWRKLNVDMSVPLRLFLCIPPEIYVLRSINHSTVPQPENFEISPQRVSGLTAGIPVTANGEPDKEFRNQVMTEIENINWRKLKPLEKYSAHERHGYYDPGHFRNHLFSKQIVQKEQVFEISVLKTTQHNNLHVGFTNRNPASLDARHVPDPAAAWSVDRADYWIFTKFDLTQGFRVLMKVKNSGEVLVLFGEEDFRLLKVDFSEPLWFFVHTRDGIQNVTLRTDEKPLRNITGYVTGKEDQTVFSLAKHFNTKDYWSKLEPLDMYEYKSEIFQPDTLYNQNILMPTAFPVPKYVFSLDCVQLNRYHRIVIKASKTQLLRVGFTSRDPAGLDIAHLPKPAALGQRADYWIYTSFELPVGISNEIAVHVKLLRGGKVIMWGGKDDFRVFEVDTTRPLWLFLNGEGVTIQYSESKSEVASPPPKPRLKKRENLKECVICKDRNIDSVILNCGHVCCCYNCAVAERERSENCPVCRQSITGVNMLYFS